MFGDLVSVDIFALANDKINFISHSFVKNVFNLEQLLLPSQLFYRFHSALEKGIDHIDIIDFSAISAIKQKLV